MTGPVPAVAQVRSQVRAELEGLTPGELVLAAVSGGQDSLALAAGLAFEAPRLGLRSGAVIVDHQLQEGSAAVAVEVGQTLRGLGLGLVEVVAVEVGTSGGLEAAARRARYDALEQVADRLGASVVLLGHTRDDQAESVLLGLARGSGARSLAGMARARGRFRRPLLGVGRETTAQACQAAGLEPWVDPHNADPTFARVRVREAVMPLMEERLGPGVAKALARTADLLRDDDAALEAWATALLLEVRPGGSEAEVDCEALSAAPPAVRRRVLRHAVIDAGVSGGSLRHEHLVALDALVSKWRGQGAVDLPGGVRAERTCGRLRIAREAAAGRDHRSHTEVEE